MKINNSRPKLLLFIFILLVNKKKEKQIRICYTNLCDIRHVFKMYSKSNHEYLAFKKVFEYNANTCIHIFLFIHMNTQKTVIEYR